jgi:hypothetical protein
MSEPIVLISHHGVVEGRADEFRLGYRSGTKRLEADKPGTVAFLHYLDEEASEVTSIHVFPDAKAMEMHMEGVDERVGKAAQFLEFRRFEVYGAPSEKTLQFLRQSAEESGMSLIVKPEYVAGYLRLKSG